MRCNMIDPRTKNNNIETSTETEEEEINVNFEEYENLFFQPSEDEIEEACELANFYANY